MQNKRVSAVVVVLVDSGDMMLPGTRGSLSGPRFILQLRARISVAGAAGVWFHSFPKRLPEARHLHRLSSREANASQQLVGLAGTPSQLFSLFQLNQSLPKPFLPLSRLGMTLAPEDILRPRLRLNSLHPYTGTFTDSNNIGHQTAKAALIMASAWDPERQSRCNICRNEYTASRAY